MKKMQFFLCLSNPSCSTIFLQSVIVYTYTPSTYNQSSRLVPQWHFHERDNTYSHFSACWPTRMVQKMPPKASKGIMLAINMPGTIGQAKDESEGWHHLSQCHLLHLNLPVSVKKPLPFLHSLSCFYSFLFFFFACLVHKCSHRLYREQMCTC